MGKDNNFPYLVISAVVHYQLYINNSYISNLFVFLLDMQKVKNLLLAQKMFL